MLLYNKNIHLTIMMSDYLRNIKIPHVLKNNYIYYEDNFEENVNDKYIINFELYHYYFFHFNLNLFQMKCVKKRDFKIYFQIDRKLLPFYKGYYRRYFFPKGNVIIMNFSTNYISNPLDVLYTINKLIVLKGYYKNVVIDYLLFRNKIIYYIYFSYSGKLEANLKEIINHIKLIKNSKITSFNDSLNKIDKDFQNLFLHNFSKIRDIDKLKFESLYIYSPYEKEVMFNE
ncbi:MAG: hypothetical protein ACQESN_10235 [Thermotogota bacterium]